MSCGLRDVVNLEASGRPALLVHTLAFDEAASRQAEMLGQPAIRRAAVTHPIQDKSEREIRGLAASSVADLVSALTIS